MSSARSRVGGLPAAPGAAAARILRAATHAGPEEIREPLPVDLSGDGEADHVLMDKTRDGRYADCVPLRGDSTRAAVSWKDAAPDQEQDRGATIQLQFHLQGAVEIYSYAVA